MRRRLHGKIPLMIAALFCATSVIAAPSGLNVIPTTDVLDKGTLSIETESCGAGLPWSGKCNRSLLLQFGVGGGAEFGVDRSLGSSNLQANGKVRLFEESKRRPTIAFGIQGLENGRHPQYYLAVAKRLITTRLHAGILTNNGRSYLMLGMDRPMSPLVGLQVDYTQGDSGSLTYGLTINLGGSLLLTFARSLGNTADGMSGQIVNIAWSISTFGE